MRHQAGLHQTAPNEQFQAPGEIRARPRENVIERQIIDGDDFQTLFEIGAMPVNGNLANANGAGSTPNKESRRRPAMRAPAPRWREVARSTPAGQIEIFLQSALRFDGTTR
jgi:hypothetical protein